MLEFFSRGLMWIRYNADEKPVWIGGDAKLAVPPSIAHLFANTALLSPDQERAERVRRDIRERARRDLITAMDYVMERRSTINIPSERVIEGYIAH